MVDNLLYIWTLLKINMKSSLTLRVTYAIRMIFNISQHAIYMVLWILIFDQIESIGGWQVEHILLAYGIGIMVWGLISFLAYGLRKLPQKIDNGELDVYLTQPRPLLINIAMGSHAAVGPPEIIFGFIVLTIASIMTGVSLLWLMFSVVCAALVFGSIILAYGSLGFWFQDFNSTSEEVNFNIFIVSNRPEGLFSGWMQMMVYTFIPVAYMTFLPIEFLLEHKITALLTTVCGVVACMCISYIIFQAGLKRYESGNRFGVKG